MQDNELNPDALEIINDVRNKIIQNLKTTLMLNNHMDH